MKQILVVDDDPAILDVVQIVLEEEGYSVQTDMGDNVAVKVTGQQPSLVLLDIWMNGVDGREVAKQLKRDFPDVPVILMSAHSSAKSAVEETGVEGFLEKPFEVDDLLATVSQWISQR